MPVVDGDVARTKHAVEASGEGQDALAWPCHHSGKGGSIVNTTSARLAQVKLAVYEARARTFKPRMQGGNELVKAVRYGYRATSVPSGAYSK